MTTSKRIRCWILTLTLVVDLDPDSRLHSGPGLGFEPGLQAIDSDLDLDSDPNFFLDTGQGQGWG